VTVACLSRAYDRLPIRAVERMGQIIRLQFRGDVVALRLSEKLYVYDKSMRQPAVPFPNR
jgi:hypothetical protein